MDENDRRGKKHAAWRDMLGRVRAYAKLHARRHFVICDAHTPTGGYGEDGQLLFDAHAFPLRIADADLPSTFSVEYVRAWKPGRLVPSKME